MVLRSASELGTAGVVPLGSLQPSLQRRRSSDSATMAQRQQRHPPASSAGTSTSAAAMIEQETGARVGRGTRAHQAVGARSSSALSSRAADLRKWAAEASAAARGAAGAPPSSDCIDSSSSSSGGNGAGGGASPLLRRMRSVSPSRLAGSYSSAHGSSGMGSGSGSLASGKSGTGSSGSSGTWRKDATMRELRTRPRSIHGHQALPTTSTASLPTTSSSIASAELPASESPLQNKHAASSSSASSPSSSSSGNLSRGHSLPTSPTSERTTTTTTDNAAAAAAGPPSSPRSATTLARASALKSKSRPAPLRSRQLHAAGEDKDNIQHVRFDQGPTSENEVVSIHRPPFIWAPSPLWSAGASSSASTEDALVTPRAGEMRDTGTLRLGGGGDEGGDELTPVHDRAQARRLSAVAAADADASQQPGGTADRSGSNQGVGALGASTDVGELIAGLYGRRGSEQSVFSSSSSSSSASAASYNDLSSRDLSHDLAALALIPALSRASLQEIGQIEGITPPSMSSAAAAAATTSSSSSSSSSRAELSTVVSAGLEMGLGVHLAANALQSNLPGASSAVSSLAEPRFARPTHIDYDTISLAAKLTEREIWTDDRGPAGGGGEFRVTATVADQSVLDDPAAVGYELAQAELMRRQTTGAMHVPTKRMVPEGGTRTRAGTHDFGPPPPTSISRTNRRTTGMNLSFAPSNGASAAHAQDAAMDYHSAVSTPSIGYSASTTDQSHRHRDRESATASTQIGTPSMHDKALLSPATSHQLSSAGDFLGNDSGKDRSNHRQDHAERREGHAVAHVPLHQPGGQIGVGGGSHFGPGVRAKVLEVLDGLITGVPLESKEGETITVVEYGSLSGRSLQLMQPILTKFLAKAHPDVAESQEAQGARTRGDFFSLLKHHSGEEEPCRVSFSIMHEDGPQADFRPLMQQLDNASISYLNPTWQAQSQPQLGNQVYSSFVARPFASRIAPPSTVHMGLSLMDLHWSHTPPNPAVSLSTTADAELTAFLSTRAHEFKQGGVLVLGFIARSEEGRSSGSGTASPAKQRTDLWTVLTNTLAPCIQRLVSCGMLKSDVARHMLSLPLHPRTAKQTLAVLESQQHAWDVEWSCGLGQSQSDADGQPSEPDPVRLPHPAWIALQAGTLSRVAFAEHMIQLFKNLYESHFRQLLRSRLSKGAVEFVLDSLFDILHSRIDDQDTSPIEGVELEVCLCALRRR